MKTSELLILLTDYLKDNADILAWVNEKYSKTHTISLGIDMDNPPSSSLFPLIMIIGAKRVATNASNRLIWQVKMGFVVEQDEVIESGNTIIHTGLLQNGDFKEKVEDTLSNSKGLGKISFDSEFQDIKDFPDFVSGSVLTIEMIKRRKI